jgi:adenylate cyclase
MICDLKGFTAASNTRPAAEILAMLDMYFDRVVPSIVQGGGEIVKFMGDAVLAFFQSDDARNSCRAAMDAARNALIRLARETPMSASVALHYGQMNYGNIGSGRRLDFTVIGPDVNLVSRVQGVCASTGDDILVSDRFAKLLGSGDIKLLGSGDMKSAGFHSLKGFDEPVHLFAYRPKRDPSEQRAPQDPP